MLSVRLSGLVVPIRANPIQFSVKNSLTSSLCSSATWITTPGFSAKSFLITSSPLISWRLICKPPSALAKVISSNVVIKPPAEMSCPASIHSRRIISCTASKQSQKYCGSFTVGTSLPILPRLCAKAEPPKHCSSKLKSI